MSLSVYSKTPFLLSAFLAGVAIRSFFDIPQNLVMALVGLAAGLALFVVLAQILQGHAYSPAGELLCSGRRPAQGLAKIAPAPTQNPQTRVLQVAVFAGIFLLGILRFSFFENNISKDELHNHYGEILSISGVVLSSAEKANSARVILETDLGRLLIVARPYPKYKYGEKLEVRGEILEPKPYGDFDIKSYLAKDRIYSEMVFPEIKKIGYEPPNKILNILFVFKEKFENNLEKILPEPHSSLANGMLLGREGVLDADILDAFKRTGTIHILVLSGYNITIVGVFLMAAFGFLPEFFAWIMAIFGIILFTLMTGAEPAAARAALMATIGLLAFRTGRLKSAMLALLWAAALMILWNPMYLRFDRGFQLSFLATLGLILLQKRFEKIVWFTPKFMGVRESASATLSAQIFVLPLLISWGNFVSFWSPLVNVLVVGAVPAVMFFSFLGGIVAFFSYYLGAALAAVSYVLISYQIYIVNFFAQFNI